MSDDLLVECPIHLDAVSSKNILILRCGHGFCEPCLEEHSRRSNHLVCPTCRKTFRRNEPFHIFLTPAHSMTQSGSTDPEAYHTRLVKEVREAKAAHTHCLERVIEFEHEMDILKRDVAQRDQTIYHLRGKCESQEERLAKEADKSARAQEENNLLKEEFKKLQVENHNTSVTLDQALKDKQAEHERAKMFQGYMEQHRHKYNLERKKRKAIEIGNHHLQPRKEEESLMVIDANAPDVLCHDGNDFGWLDEACKVKGDQLAVSDDEEMVSVKEGEDDEVGTQLRDYDGSGKQREDRAPDPPHQFLSDWNFKLGESSCGTTRKRRRPVASGASKIVKVKIPRGTGTHKQAQEGGPLAIDRNGRVKGTVALGSRQKFTSKN